MNKKHFTHKYKGGPVRSQAKPRLELVPWLGRVPGKITYLEIGRGV